MRGVSGLINDCKSSVRISSDLTLLRKPKILWQKKDPYFLKMLSKEPCGASIPSAPAMPWYHPCLAIASTHSRGMEFWWECIGHIEKPIDLYVTFAEPDIQSKKSSKFFWACALGLPTGGLMINHELCTEQQKGIRKHLSSGFSELAPRICSYWGDLGDHSNEWEPAPFHGRDWGSGWNQGSHEHSFLHWTNPMSQFKEQFQLSKTKALRCSRK